ncbi:MAG: 4-alpha-glucanotransferase [Acidobacteria bacterium]|nr:MAG: 4-alpha-glucanotransferase [Acidobacteriota bacterium]
MKTTMRPLRQLAEAYGIQSSYQNILDGRRTQASPDVLVSILRSLGAPLARPEEAFKSLREHRQHIYLRGPEPIAVAWDGHQAAVKLRLPVGRAIRSWRCSLRLENGEERVWEVKPDRSEPASHAKRVSVEGTPYWEMDMVLPRGLPFGYHTLSVEARRHLYRALVISAPRKAFVGPGGRTKKSWGVFIPLYALRSDSNWGVGDFGDLKELMEWVHARGGSLVGTLPLLASFLDEPFNPSPYSPVSRLFWNELFLDFRRIPEMEGCLEALDLMQSTGFKAEREELRSHSLVDYRRAMALKRKALEPLARKMLASPSGRQQQFFDYVEAHPDLKDYAQFRATCDRRRSSWWTWPEPLREGKLSRGDYDLDAMHYHLYVQWLAEEQIRSFAKGCGSNSEGLYLDLPLGVDSDGYDVWRERPSFVLDVSAGSPPDGFFTKGQSWGFPPMHPEKIREEGYTYLRKALQHHLAHACVLRIDHVMGLHRLFWVPKGYEPRDGAYVRYPAEEMYAILALESVRNRAFIVGEDLGTVPGYVRPALARHKIQRMYVMQFEVAPDEKRPLLEPDEDSLAALNTHDMPPFAAFWEGLDVQDRVDLGLLAKEEAITELGNRSRLRNALARFLCADRHQRTNPSIVDVLKAALKFLGSGRNRIAMVNLEDLWFEKRPQNVPGTCGERPNWKRKARYSLQQITQIVEIAEMLEALDTARRRKEI